MRRSTAFVGGLVWVLVVAGVSLVTWQVIDAAGRDVMSEQTRATGSGTSSSRPDPTPTRGGTSPGKPPGKPSSAAPAAEVRSWQGVAGTVVVQCLGAKASLRSTYPNVGWAYEVKKTGPVEVRVEFERDSSDGQARVRAGCVGGVPQFSLDDVEGVGGSTSGGTGTGTGRGGGSGTGSGGGRGGEDGGHGGGDN